MNNVALGGTLTAKKIGMQRAPLAWRVRNMARWYFIWGWLAHVLGHLYSRLFGAPVMLGKLSAIVTRADGTRINYGVLGYRVVTTAFVNFVVDQLQAETSVFGDFLYHDSGVGSTAENVTDTAIETTDGESRASGTQTEGASANIYRSVGTIAYTSTLALREHGLFNASTAGTLMDRTVFTAINVVNGDSVQYTYELTVTAGS